MAGPRTRRCAAVAPLLLLGVALPAGAHAGDSAVATADPARPAVAAAATDRAARVDPALQGDGSDPTAVVVRLRAGSGGEAARAAVQRLGGSLTRDLPLVDGFAATLPGVAVRELAAAPDVEVVSADRAVQVQASAPEAAVAAAEAAAAAVAPQAVRAPAAWAAGATGKGVTVAVVDTGIADVPDLAGRIVPVRDQLGLTTSPCYDLSGEGTCRDSYGHGTFMAGLIAGNGARRGGAPTGAAPQANVLSVKIAGPSGAADVSTVLAAVQWVVSFKDRYGIRVLNLSLGTDSTQSWEQDPLNYAVERAWDAGIVVVVAAANNGPGPGTVSKPGDDPWVITAGAVDDHGTAALGDDRLPDFSSRGPTRHGVAKPDLVAPGGHVLSLNAPGSQIELAHGAGTGGYRRGSGTSMAAAVVSGVVATTLQAHPRLTPDQVKHVLTRTARPTASTDRHAVGAGMVDARQPVLAPPAGAANAGLARSTGRGSLAASRGTVRVQLDDDLGTVLGNTRQTAQLIAWKPLDYVLGTWSPLSWYTSANAVLGWNTATWYPFEGHNWTGHNWTGSSFYGVQDPTSTYGERGDGSASYGAWD